MKVAILLLVILNSINITLSITNVGIQSIVLGLASSSSASNSDANEQLIRLLTFGHMQASTGIASINKRKGTSTTSS